MFGKKLSPKAQGRAGRVTVIVFAGAAILVSFQINTVEQGWRWLAAITSSLAVPTLLRWFWWRVSAFSEITAIVAGLITAIMVHATGTAYEFGLICIMLLSVAGMLLGIFLGPKTDPEVLESFYSKVRPGGVWPSARRFPGRELLLVAGIVGFIILLLKTCVWLIFGV